MRIDGKMNTESFMEMNSFVEILEYWTAKRPNKDILIFLEDGGLAERRLSYGELSELALQYAAGLRSRGIERGDRVLIMLPTGPEFFSTFFGTALVGAVPVPVYPPFSLTKIQHYLDTLTALARNCKGRILITFEQVTPVVGSVMGGAPSLKDIVLAQNLPRNPSQFHPEKMGPEDVALIQYTSGTTSQPKGVKLLYQNIFANIRALSAPVNTLPEGHVACSWLPVYHDFGLIAAAFFSLYWGCPIHIMSPLHFLARPARWLQAISKYRCSISAAPNFAYERCTRKISDADLKGVDLSCWRFALNGAEPIRKSTIEAFIERFSHYGFKREAILPVYGMAENTVSVTCPETNGPKYLKVVESSLQTGGNVILDEGNEEKTVDCISVGFPYPGHRLHILDDQGNLAPEGVVGEIVIGGPSLSPGYYDNQNEFDKLVVYLPGDETRLFRTGDLGFLHGGELYITGRKKDMIIVRGRNYYPQDIEAVIETCPTIRAGCSAAFSIQSGEGTEALIIAAESTVAGQEGHRRAIEDVKDAVIRSFGIMAEDVILLPPRTIPKTSSGKIRRSKTRELYVQNALVQKDDTGIWMKGKVFLNSYMGYARFYMRKLQNQVKKFLPDIVKSLPEIARKK